MPSNRKKWIKPGLQSIDRSIFETWDRDQLTRAREFVHDALELIEASGQAREAAAQVRAILADIDTMLQERPSGQP